MKWQNANKIRVRTLSNISDIFRVNYFLSSVENPQKIILCSPYICLIGKMQYKNTTMELINHCIPLCKSFIALYNAFTVSPFVLISLM